MGLHRLLLLFGGLLLYTRIYYWLIISYHQPSFYLTGIQYCSGKPTLRPASVHTCPNETVTFTCHDTQIVAIAWELDMYIKNTGLLTFSFSQPVGSHGVAHMGMISANLSEVTRRNGTVADITTTLTIITRPELNIHSFLPIIHLYYSSYTRLLFKLALPIIQVMKHHQNCTNKVDNGQN